jgi:hypothetical protein
MSKITFTKHTLVLIALLVVAGIFVGYSVGSTTTTYAITEIPREAPAIQTWVVVDTTEWVTKDGKSAAVTRRECLVDSDGRWYEIPEAHNAWAAAIVQGASVVLPGTVTVWPRSWALSKWTPKTRPSGWYTVDKGDHYTRVEQGTFFYVE